MTADPGPMPTEAEPARVQLHIWVSHETAEWVRDQAHQARLSRGKLVERIITLARQHGQL